VLALGVSRIAESSSRAPRGRRASSSRSTASDESVRTTLPDVCRYSGSARPASQFGSNIDLIAPASFISLVIPPALFFAFQRYFVQGLLAGAVK
jgi:ABC-type glycerol-3-phosphate transport system permease component